MPEQNPASANSMPASGHSAPDAKVELLLGRLLRAGVIVAAVLTMAGAGILLMTNDTGSGRELIRQSGQLSTRGIFREVARGDGNAIIMLGLMVLIATPVLRVAGMVAAFLWERDRLYAAISLGVLAILILGICFAG